MSLLDTERRMAAAVMRPLTTRWGMQKRTAEGGSTAEEAAGFIKPNARLSSFDRLEIYNRQYWFRVLSILAEDFPALEAALGKKRFEKLSRAYLEQNPSRSFTLRNLGSKLESWLRANPQWAGEQYDVAIEVVQLEWAYVEAFDNGEEPALTLADLAGLDAGSRLSLQPHVRLLDLNFAIDDFIIEVHRRQATAGVSSNAMSEMGGGKRQRRMDGVDRSKTKLAVHRFEHCVYYKRLAPEAYHLLASLQSGLPLGDALERAFESSEISPEAQAALIQEWFLNWAELGWFCRHRRSGTAAGAGQEEELHAE
ncbi:MAG TPA: DNA-binding domain-containing protein [Acidobacteriaceae bacterium]|nr:DNA-binding domain-containing protein [Acidobacteriaceae bacterium]